MKTKMLFFFLCFLGLQKVNAQNSDNSTYETRFFEGELRYRSVENHDKFTVEASSGMAYNGARNVTYIIKGNKILFIDECTHMRTLIDAAKNQVTLYSDLINQGMEFKYESYEETYFSAFSEKGSSYMGHGNPPTLYRFKNEGEGVFMEKTVDFIKGRIENNTASTDFEFYSDSHIVLPTLYSKIFTYGVDIKGLIVKMKWVQNNQISLAIADFGKGISKKVAKRISKMTGSNIPDIGEAKTFVLSELKDIKERKVEDAELLVPANVTIDNSESPFKVIELYKKNHAYLINNNMYPTQLNKDVLYAIDEEWDY